ncbi:hypothetical protein WJX81_005307 [Elliptochloris bilobata]|uniref:Enkurin domain-containing protein n=1 Tax=Elliptochloris bilobata TaxID=381761 RepID=A0AAW1QLQ1_9CHLO
MTARVVRCGDDGDRASAWAGWAGSADWPQCPRRQARPRLAMHQDSSQLRACLDPVRGFRDEQLRRGLTPVDHARANAAAVRRQSAENRQRKVDEAVAASVAASRVATAPPDVRSSGYASTAYHPGRPGSASTADAAKENAGGDNCNPHGERSDKGSKSGEPSGSEWVKKREYGRVPAYLLDIKLRLAQQHAAKQAKKEAALIPAGMRVLPEEEREEMLGALGRTRAELERQMQALPFVIETPSARRHKAELDARFAEVEEALVLFSRRTVLVKDDE